VYEPQGSIQQGQMAIRMEVFGGEGGDLFEINARTVSGG
jgi:hypothetical protein